MDITPGLRAARTITRAKTTSYTALRVAWTVVAVGILAYLATRGASTWVTGALVSVAIAFYGAGRVAGLSVAERAEKPYFAEMEAGEELEDLPSRP